MEYSTLISSPGRTSPRPEEAEASFNVVVQEIDTYQINLNSKTQQLELLVKFADPA